MARFGFISCTKGLSWAATDGVLMRCVKAANARGHSVALSVDRSAAQRWQDETLSNKQNRVFARHPFRPHRLYMLKERFSCLGKFRRSNPDLVLFNAGSIQDQFHQRELLHFLETYDGPVVYYCHGHSELYQLTNRVELREFTQRMAAFIFVADENLQSIQAQIPVAMKNSFVVPNAPTFECEKQIAWPTANGVRFATVSRLESFWKGHRTVLRVLAEERWKGRDWSLDIYGSGPDENYIRELATHLGIENRVKLHGHVEDIREVWRNCHVLLHASWAESLSLAVLEAMMAGRPVVCAESGDIRKYVKSDAGFVSDAATPYSFGIALENAWQQRDLWSEFGARGHVVASKLFNSDPAEKVLNIIENAIAPNSVYEFREESI